MEPPTYTAKSVLSGPVWADVDEKYGASVKTCLISLTCLYNHPVQINRSDQLDLMPNNFKSYISF